MEKKNLIKKGLAIVLSAAMVLGIMPSIGDNLKEVQAATTNTAPTPGYWTDAAGLKGFGLSGTKTIGKIRFGAGNRLWAICGADGNNLALLSTSEFGTAAYGSTSEYSKSNFVNGIDTYLANNFSIGETGKMAEVTVSTNEPGGTSGNQSVTVDNKKLYLPNSYDQSSYEQKTIYVGSSNDIAIDVQKLNSDNGFQTNYFWLRSPYDPDSDNALVVFPDYSVTYLLVGFGNVSVVPAFNLNLSSDIFASAAEAASSSYSGYKANSDMTENTYTLRYTYTAGEDSAVINSSGTQVKVTNASGKYLMVQNSTGVFALQIQSNDKTVTTSDITGMALDNFNNCKVWIESTDTDRITTAKMATQATVTSINSVELTDITPPVAGAALDTEAACATEGVDSTTPVTWKQGEEAATGNAGYNTTYTASVTLTAGDDYEFASSVTATVNGQNATSVTKNTDGTVIVTYTYNKTAAKAVSNAYFATVDDLKECYNISDGTIGKIKFGLNGSDARLWAICGADGDNLALLSTSDFARAEYGSTSEYSKSNFVAGIDTYLTNNFSTGETDKMAVVTVSTNEPLTGGTGGNQSVTVENKKLYLPNSYDQSSLGQTTVYVGSSNNIAIDVTKLDDVGLTNLFWLRSPDSNLSYGALVADPGLYVDYDYVYGSFSVVPAFNLNLSSDIFASAAEAASSSYSGYKANSDMTVNTFTLRYASTGDESAVISPSGTQVEVTDAGGKYLMVQNDVGVYALAIDNNDKTVNASDITGMALDNFNNCKVWIESTDTDRITTAKMATQATAPTIDSVAVTDITAPAAGSALDTEAACATTGVETTSAVTWKQGEDAATGNAGYNTTYTASVTLTAGDDYAFASNVTATVNGQNATSVTKNTDGTVTVTYTYNKTAAKAVSNAYFATVDDLKECYNISDGTIGKIKFGLNGSDARLWAICGADGDNLALLSTSEFATAAYGSTSEYSKSNFATGIDTYLTNNFSIGETGKMAEVTVTTNEPDGSGGNSSKEVTNKKLYLPNSYDQSSSGQTTIYVGSSNNIAIDVTKLDDVGLTNLFWLRSPINHFSYNALVAIPGNYVSGSSVNGSFSVVPALNLNLSSDIFASAAEAASSTGYVEKASMTENTYTLRYLSGGSETAVVNAAGSSIAITGATDTMYLVAQNNTGAYAKKLTSSTTSVSANDIDGLDNFNNCKVWLESTDDDRITTAKMATQETASVTITADATMTKTSESGAESQTGITGDMAEVVYTANSGYYFPSDYSVTPVNGISVTRLSASQIKVSGAPTAVSVEITLSAATEKGTADTPEIGINYSDETLTGFDTTKKYSINGGTEFTPTASTIAIEDSYFGNTITIKETASDTANESAEKEVVIPARPAAPSVTPNNENVTGKGDGSITGVDSTMEYHSTDQTNWNDCTGTTIPNLTSGTYYVRIAATNTSFKSSPATVVIGSNAEKKIALAVTAPLFATVTEGYTRPEAKDITIANDTTNGANWDATVSGVTLTGTDAESFAVSGSGNTWTVQPKAGLTANTDGTAKTYTATINVAYDATAGVTSPATADVSFTVNPKSNTVTVTNGTGSATYNKGEAVTAIANTASTGYIFTGWTGIDGLTLLEGTTATSETIKFTMPEGAVGITANYKDNAAPTATIKVKNNTWSQIFNTITFGYFFKDTQTVTITGTDNESGVRRIEYSLKNAEVLDLSTITDWTDYNNTPFSIDPSRKYVIYARVTDNADHTTIVNSKGIVVYQDATADTTSIQYVKAAPSDKTAKVNLNGNTVKEIKNGATTIDATNYSVAADGTITFKSNYLDTLAVADSPYTLTISYNPLGESWVADVNNDEPATTTLNVTVVNSIAPVITSGPANATVIEGNTATFTVVATGTPAPTYQWQVNKGTTWEDITTATSASYTTSATTLENSGYQYQCVVKNGEESSDRVVSNAATLTVTDPSVTPSITTHPANATVIEGNTATFTVAATGTPAPTYQWQINKGTTWENINDAQSASYTTSETVKANDGYKYRCVVTNRKGSVTSNEATLTVTDKPVTTYTITVASDNNGTAFANITTATSGTKVTLTATPKDGYQFKEWQVLEGGVTITSNEFTMPASNVSVKAIFEKKASGDDNNKPTGPSLGDGIKGWSDIKDKIQDEIKDATEKVTITIDMGGETKVPGDVIESIKGKDVDVVFDLGNGIKWTVNGKDVTGTNIGEIDFGVTTGTSTIPVDVVNEVTGERYSIQISLAYNGEFGFTATLSINMDAKNAGYYANLYYYNKSTGKLEFMNAGKIDGEGNVELTFTHASDYTIVVSDKAMNETETPTPETPSTTPTETDSPKTGDTSPILLWVLVLIGSGIGVTAVASKKRKRETK